MGLCCRHSGDNGVVHLVYRSNDRLEVSLGRPQGHELKRPEQSLEKKRMQPIIKVLPSPLTR